MEAYGAYRNEEREILMTVVSKSEFLQLRRLLLAADPEVFIIIEENVFVVGNFQKRVNPIKEAPAKQELFLLLYYLGTISPTPFKI